MDINIATQTVNAGRITEALASGEANLHDETYAVTITAKGNHGEFSITDSTGGDADAGTLAVALTIAAEFIHSVNGVLEAPNYCDWSELSDLLDQMANA